MLAEMVVAAAFLPNHCAVAYLHYSNFVSFLLLLPLLLLLFWLNDEYTRDARIARPHIFPFCFSCTCRTSCAQRLACGLFLVRCHRCAHSHHLFGGSISRLWLLSYWYWYECVMFAFGIYYTTIVSLIGSRVYPFTSPLVVSWSQQARVAAVEKSSNAAGVRLSSLSLTLCL